MPTLDTLHFATWPSRFSSLSESVLCIKNICVTCSACWAGGRHDVATCNLCSCEFPLHAKDPSSLRYDRLCGSVEGKEENRGKTWPVMEPLMRAQHCLLGRFLTRLKENDLCSPVEKAALAESSHRLWLLWSFLFAHLRGFPIFEHSPSLIQAFTSRSDE